MPSYNARELLMRTAERNWACGDPGIQFDDTIQKWHTTPNAGPIRSSNPCLRRGSRILTAGGWRAIDELTPDGKKTAVDLFDGFGFVAGEVWRTGRKPIVRLHTNSGEMIDLTADHQVYTVDGWRAAKDCDGTTLPRVTPPPSTMERAGLLRAVTGGSGHFYNHPGVELMEAIGFLQGDGGIREGAATVYYTPEKDQAFVDETVLPVLQDIAADSGESSYAASPLSNGAHGYVLCRKKLVEWLLANGFQAKPLPERTLPALVWQVKRPAQAAFLRGLFGANGNILVDARTAVNLVSSCRELLRAVQLLLRSMGILSAVRIHNKAQTVQWANGEYESKEAYRLEITHQQDIAAFARLVGFPQESQQARLLSIVRTDRVATNDARFTQRTSMKVVQVEDLGIEDDVYDFKVPSTSVGLVDGFVVHNCSEFIHVDNTACNLACLNLLRFLKEDGSFDYLRFGHAVEVLVTAQDILIDSSSYPTEAIAKNSHDLRPIGLGYTNLGALLMAKGLPYDSDEGRELVATITSYMTMVAYHQSAVMAGELGAYAGFAADREGHLKVLRMHYDSAAKLPPAALASCPGNLLKEWKQVIELAEQYGLRNSQVTSLMPAGTVSFMMGAATTGIEPELALVKYKRLAGGGSLTLVNDTVEQSLKRLEYAVESRHKITEHIKLHGTIEGCPALKPDHLPVFACSFPPLGGAKTLLDGTPIEGRSLHYSAHIKMMAAIQPHISTAQSKTVNMPKSSTVDDFFNVYIEAWKLGLKAVAIYRDGCKDSQPLSTSKEDKDAVRGGSDDDAARGGVGGGVPAERALPDLLVRTTEVSKAFITGLDRDLGAAGGKDDSDCTGEVTVAWSTTGLTDERTTTDGDRKPGFGVAGLDAVHPLDLLLLATGQPVVGGQTAEAKEAGRSRAHAPVGKAAKTGGSRAHASTREPAAAVAADPAGRDRQGGAEDRGADVRHQLVPTRGWSRTVTGAGGTGQPTRHKLPLTRMSLTHKFDVGAHGGYLNVGLYDDGKVGELFITMDKEGSIVAGLMDALATTCSIGLQYGVPLEAFVRKLAFTAYEPNGMTNDKDVPFAKSLVDYIFRKLGILYVPGYREEVQGPSSPDKPVDARAAQMVDLARQSLTTGQLAAFTKQQDDSCYVSAVARLVKEAAARGKAVSEIDILAARALCASQQVEDAKVFYQYAPRPDSVELRESLCDEPDAEVMAILQAAQHQPEATGTPQPPVPAEHGPPCDQCGHLMVRAGACYRCLNCGSQGGCG